MVVDEHLRRQRVIDKATKSTALIDRHRSVLTGLTAGQKGGGYGLAGAGLVYLLLCAEAALIAITFMASVIFLANTVLRCYALFLSLVRRIGESDALRGRACHDSSDLPVYTILVPLYREANVVEGLIDSLYRLNYPRHKLDIKFLVEADDPETIQAVRTACPDGDIDILIVPPSAPRTKPKALNYGLGFARGAYLVVFDAEDRPHPDQLLAAARTFRDSTDRLAVVQHRLQPYNGCEGWISGNFEWEYIRQFHILLPALSRLGLPMQLGGSSNHFRTDILRRIGGWDAYNVTEDAEIGLYLFMKGYRTSVHHLPTMEEAPESIKTFINQRTRWIKGHIQTWLVIMRNPAHFISQTSFLTFAGFQISFGNSILSHLICVPGTLILLATVGQGMCASHLILGILLAVNLAMILVEIGMCRTPNSSYLGRLSHICFLPAYMTLQFVAALRALWEMKTDPYRWSKTPHGITAAPFFGDQTTVG